MTNQLNINTGYNPNTNAYYSLGGVDLYWQISYNSSAHQAVAPYSTPYHAFVVTPNAAWTNAINSRWLCFLSNPNYTTNANVNDSTYYSVYTRHFKNCIGDTYTFSLQYAADNWLSSVVVDGVSYFFQAAPSSPSSSQYNAFNNITTFTANLSPGTHTIDIAVFNYPAAGTNPTGFNLQGTVAGTMASLQSDACSTYTSVTVTTSPHCLGDTLHLSASTVGNASASFQWTGPNSFSSTQQSPVIPNIVIADTGNYIVTASLNTCTASDTVHISLSPYPTVNASVTSPICIGDLLYMSASGTVGTNYSWTGPNNFSYPSSSNVSIANANASNAGTYYLIANLNGCIVHDTFNVAINPKPAKPIASNNGPLCSVNTLSLSATCATSGVSYQWTGPNNYSSSQQNATRNPVTTLGFGSYIVAATLNGCSTYDTTHVIVNPGMDSVYYSILYPICTGDTLRLTAGSASSGVNFSWTGPNSFSTTSPNAKIANAQLVNSGPYYFSSSANGCTIHDTINVVINQTPATPVGTSNTPVCTPSPLQLSATCATSGVNYRWTGPNNINVSTQNFSLSGINTSYSGSYVITVAKNGCQAKDTIQVSVANGPDSVYATLNTPLCTGDTLRLRAGSNTTGVTYSWSGPSYSSSAANNNILNVGVANSGTYYMNVSLNSCVVHDTLHLVVNQQPSIPTLGSNSPLCEGGNLALTANGTAGASYNWTGPNIYTSSVQNASRNNVVMADSGYYYATANIGNCVATANVHITIKPLPQQVTITSNSPICAGDSLKFTVNSLQSGLDYSWLEPGNMSVTTQNLGIANTSTTNTGNYYLTVTLNGCSIHDTINAVVKPLPNIPGINSNSPLCAGTILTLSVNNVQTGVNYNWTGPNSFSPTIYNPTLSNAQTINAGNYKVTANLNGCLSKDSVNIIINPLPSVPVAISNSPVCVGDTVKLNVSNLQTGVNYSWAGPAGFTANTVSAGRINAQSSFAGSYTLTADLNGCTESGSTSVSILAQVSPPTVSISVSPGDTVCAGTNLTFSAIAGNAGSPVYSWYKNGSNLGVGNTPTFTSSTMNNGDHVKCVVTGNLQCQSIDTALSNTISMDVISIAPPVVSVTSYPLTYAVGTQVTFTGHVPTGVTGLTYAWTKNGIFIPGATIAFYTSNAVSPSDVICFIAYSNASCTTPDSSVACTGTTGVSRSNFNAELSVYPNPFRDELKIEIADLARDIEASIRIYNIVGQTVYTGIINEGKVTINTYNFSSGTYTVDITNTDGERFIRKIVKY